MKLFAKVDRREGEAMPKDVLFTFGPSFDYDGGFGFERNGYYWKLVLPFTREREYVDPNTFLNVTGRCRYTIMRLKRTPYPRNEPVIFWAKVWVPV